jgi:hypothetical protein
MSMKLKTLTAAVAIAASGMANAAIDNFASGNSSLLFFAADKTGSPISMSLDLSFNLNDFLPGSTLANSTIAWNFNTNTLSVNGVQQAGTYNWSSLLETFSGTAQVAQTSWGVIAGDSTLASASDSTSIRYLSTSKSSLDLADNQTLSTLSFFSSVDNHFNNVAAGQGANDGVTASSGAAYVAHGTALGANFNWQNRSTAGSSAAAVGESLNVYFYDGVAFPGTNRATVTQFGNANGVASFSYSEGILTYTAPVPEPETYALMLAGLGLVGAIARRRKSV